MAGRTQRKPIAETVTLDISSHGRDEMNLAELPIAVLADRAPKGTKTLIFRVSSGTLTVTGSDAFGLPTALDADVIVALIQLTKQKNDFTNPCIHFTRYEILRLLGWPNEGKSYRRLDESLNRWVGVSLHYDGCWWDNRSKQYGDAKIHILESVVVLDGKSRINGDEQQALPLSSFTWNKVFMESCQADNIKRLNVEAYFALEHSTSKRLYRFLDKRFYRRSDWTFDLREIAFERVGLSRNYGHNVAKIKEKLQPAIEELESRDFLEPMSRDQRYFKEGISWKIRLQQRRILPPPPNTPQPSEAEQPAPVAELIRRGVTPSVADELVRRHAAEVIELKLDVFDWLAEKNDKRIATNPAGYLVRSIEKEYVTPKGFIPQAERTRLSNAAETRRQAAADTSRAQREQSDRQKAGLAKIAAYWASLTPEQQAEIDTLSRAQADPATLALETGHLRQMGQRIRREEYIRRLLAAQEA